MPGDLIGAITCVAAGYLLGSVPSGVLLARLFGWPDPRTHGSGHTGALNVSRGAGKGALVLVFLADVAKGLVAALLAPYLWNNPWAVTAAGIAAVIGHNWPVWLHFRGGMGLATSIGAAVLAAWPVVLVAAVSLAMIRFLIIRHSPRATIVASLTIPVTMRLLGYPTPIFWLGTGIATLAILRYASDWNRKYE